MDFGLLTEDCQTGELSHHFLLPLIDLEEQAHKIADAFVSQFISVQQVFQGVDLVSHGIVLCVHAAFELEPEVSVSFAI